MTESLNQILLVDDSPSDIQFLIENLKDEFALCVAKSGEKALEMALKSPAPSAILLDVSMPGLSGYDTCKKLKENPETENIEVIFVSAHDTIEEKLKGYDAGGTDYIIKPVQPEELKKKIRVALKAAKDRESFQQETQSAMNTALTAIMDVGELGTVVDFLRKTFEVDSLESLAETILATVTSLDLVTTIQIKTPHRIVSVSSSGHIPPLEEELLSRLTDDVRIYQNGRRLILNFGNVSQLIKNLPDDEDKVGRLRDHLAIILEGANDKCKALIMAEEMQSILLESNISMDKIHKMQTNNREKTMSIVDNLMVDVQRSFLSYGLTEEQEILLTNIIKTAVDACLDNFEDSLKIDEAMQILIDRIKYSLSMDQHN